MKISRIWSNKNQRTETYINKEKKSLVENRKQLNEAQKCGATE